MSNTTLLQLHVEILLNIFKRLDTQDLRAVMLTCKFIKDVVLNSNSIWKSITNERLILCNNSENRKYNPLSWYNRIRVSYNWCKGFYRSKVFIYHQTNYMPWLMYQNSKVVLLSVGSELCCYDTDKKGVPCNTLLWRIEVPTIQRNDIRTNDISRFLIKNEYIICGNRNGCASIYKLDSIKRKPSMYHYIQDCHKNGQLEVTAVEAVEDSSPNCIVTGSNYSPTLKYWYLCPEPTRTSYDNEHQSKSIEQVKLLNCVGVKCLAVNQKQHKLAIGPNGNSKPQLVDIATNELLRLVESQRNVKQAIRDIQWHSEHVISYVTHSGLLQLIDVRSGQMVFDISDPFQSTLYCLKSDGDYAIVVGSSEYSRCVLFDTRKSLNHVQMYFTQKKSSPIYSLDFDSSKLIAAADRSVAVVNFNVNSSSTRQRDYSHAFEFVVR